MPFVYLHVLLFAFWMLVLEQSPWPRLTLAVSLEAIFLSCFVMIGQNRQAAFQQAKADHEFLEGEQELKLNTELTREIHELTREVHERVVGEPLDAREGERAEQCRPRSALAITGPPPRGLARPARHANDAAPVRSRPLPAVPPACNDDGMGGPEETVAVRAPGVVARRALYARLSAGVSAGVTLVSAPPGSGKTVLLRSWIDEAGLRARTAWVLVERHERDAQRFWLSVVERLRSAVGRDGLVQELAPTPEFDGEGLVRRLISELEALDEPVVLVIDDLHELVSPDAQAQLELLLARRPRLLYVVLATRHDPSLGLHRLRLAGELTELRAADLRLSAEEARQLLDASGVELSAEAAAMLLARTEGWAAGLRLATMSLAGHPDPERFVAEFAGSERTVADYLLAEVLERQPEGVRQLLLRTSILERVCGPLADRLTGASGSERTLLELEDANAFVVSVDPERSWFRYHPLFADLLLLELRRSEPDAIADLHRAAAEWLAEHGLRRSTRSVTPRPPADWRLRRAICSGDYGFSLSLDGSFATIGALLEAFPADALSQSGAGRVPRLRRGDPALARHGGRVHRRWPSAMRRRCPTNAGISFAVDARGRPAGPSPAGAAIYEHALREVRPLLEPVEAETR